MHLKNAFKFLLRPPYHFFRNIYHKLTTPCSIGYIFMLHRVDEFEEGHLWPNEHMKVTPDFLDKTLKVLKEKYDIIPLTEVPARLKHRAFRKFIVFTMDDGYKDNFTKALPVFKKHDLPFTIFITTNFPDNEAVLWWYELEDLLLKNSSITLSNGITYLATTEKEKCDSFMKIREEILKLDQTNIISELNRLFSGYDINWTSKCDELCMSWADIEAIAKEPLVTIGGHTMHHYNLKELTTEDFVFSEVESGLKILEEKAGITPEVFAYPFGSSNEAGDREYDVLSRFNFKASCIAYGGPCTKKNTKNKDALPRIMLTQNFKSEDLK